MLDKIFGSVEHILSVADHKIRNKYRDEVIKLKLRYNEEVRKNEENQDFAVIDNIRSRMWIIESTITLYRAQDS